MIKMAPVQYEMFVLQGGWDQVTPTLSLEAGVCRDSVNFECSVTGGYTRIAGYERFDGHTKPSSASYSIVQVSSFTNTPVFGNVLSGAPSGGSGTVVATGSNYIVLTKVTVPFSDGDALTVGATAIGTSVTATVTISSSLDATYTNLAADLYRASIGAVPGSGPIRGIVMMSDIAYAFRDNAGGTAVDIYKSSASGWVNVPLLYEVRFSAGTTAPADGATLTQGGVTATVSRVVCSSGTWAGTASGKFVISAPSGGNFAAGAATLTGGTTVTLSGAQSAITLSPGGRFVFDVGNLYGSLSTLKIYGCDGVNRLIEFDGTTLVPIDTGLTLDRPKHIKIHKNHIFVAYQSSMLHSAVGDPYRWSVVDGAGEIATSDTITGFLVQPGAQTTAAMAVLCRNSTNILYGTGTSSWNLSQFNSGTGAIDYTCQNMAQSYFLDDRGVVSLQSVMSYGNFAQATLTRNIKTFIVDKRSKVSASSVNREKGQYRLFFNDGYGLYLTVANDKFLGAMQVYFPMQVYCTWDGETSNGNEILLAGSSTGGYVYEIDQGTSFDGESIDAYVSLNWNAVDSPRIRKRYRKASIEVSGSHFADLAFGYKISYGADTVDQPNPVNYTTNFSGVPRWDSFYWDNFVWDGITLMPSECDMVGTGENVQFTISCSSDRIAPFTLNSVIFHYTLRRGIR